MSHFNRISPSHLRVLPTRADSPRRSGCIVDKRWRDWTTYAWLDYMIVSRKGCTIVVPWEHLPLTEDALDMAAEATCRLASKVG